SQQDTIGDLIDKVLEKIKTIEIQLGRKKNGKWAPRIIDIDILFYNNIILLKENLTIPHPEIEKRKFVLMPLCELAPGLRHPVTGMTVLAMKKSLISGKKALKLEFK
ncbi:MAG TPA: 2-amino-4-hydroxy-6-hydroxymethyldihydropteridine diphosphokinase, partial [Candidatus Goldiibacteriota bacterium]|nr:2-amino-4-hydroxy-6-hydroxymethyldihydropteridine diphosphokinase [Candidatus Goldiibacteriota bacterium]